jgi:Bacterial protein of unknown function (DUF937)
MSILDSVLGQLGPDTIAKMAGQLGSNPQQTTSAIQAALPLLMGAMHRNVSQPGGADALHGAITRDHQGVDFGALLGGLLGGGGAAPAAVAPASGLGGLLGSVMGMMGGGSQQNANPMLSMGSSILGHVLGGSQQTAANGVAQASGMSAGGSAQLTTWLGNEQDWRRSYARSIRWIYGRTIGRRPRWRCGCQRFAQPRIHVDGFNGQALVLCTND